MLNGNNKVVVFAKFKISVFFVFNWPLFWDDLQVIMEVINHHLLPSRYHLSSDKIASKKYSIMQIHLIHQIIIKTTTTTAFYFRTEYKTKYLWNGNGCSFIIFLFLNLLSTENIIFTANCFAYFYFYTSSWRSNEEKIRKQKKKN